MFVKIKHITVPLDENTNLTDVFCTKFGKVIGKCSIVNTANSFELVNLWVLPKHRLTGIGKKLISYSEQLCGELGCKELHIRAIDNKIVELYTGLGYELVGADYDLLMRKQFIYG